MFAYRICTLADRCFTLVDGISFAKGHYYTIIIRIARVHIKYDQLTCPTDLITHAVTSTLRVSPSFEYEREREREEWE
jgi:hypothetical protein